MPIGLPWLATYAAISAVGQALLALLEQACPRPEFSAARFQLYQAVNFKTPMDEGVSLFLHRVVTSQVRRNLAGRVDDQGRHYRRPLPLDLQYLLTPWARTPEKQHRMLVWAMRTLEDTPTLTSSFLNHYGSPDQPAFSAEESVTVVFDPLSVQDLLNVWEVGKPNVQVSAGYVVRMVTVDSLAEDTQQPPAQTRVLVEGKGTAS